MSNRRYLELSSTYRNRREYPLQSEFIVQLSQSGRKEDGINSYTPVSTAFPIYNFDYAVDITSTFSGGTPTQPYLDPTSSSNQNGYYEGMTLVDTTLSNQSSIITTYKGTNNASLIEGPPFGSLWSPTDTYTITNTVLPTNQVRIQGGVFIHQYYKGYYLENISLSAAINNISDRFKLITSYDESTRIATLESGFTSLNTTDCFRIRKNLPLLIGWGRDTIVSGNPTVIAGNAGNAGINNSGYDGAYNIEIIQNGDSYMNGVYATNTIAGSGSNARVEVIQVGSGGRVISARIVTPGVSYQIGSQIQLIGGSNNCVCKITGVGYYIDITNALTNLGSVTGTLSLNYNNYVGNILYIRSFAPEYTNPTSASNLGYGLYYRQFPYTLSTTTCPPYSSNTTGCSVILGSFQDPSTGSAYIVAGSGYTQVVGATPLTWEILPFSNDSTVPLTYTGSTVSQQQMVCYQIKLNSLILPNVILRSGGRIAFYPFVYVELTNESASSGHQKNLIYSNNPNAVTATFRASIRDVQTPLITRFVKVDGDGEIQTIKFKPNDNLRFRVFLGDGTTFMTDANDNAPPEEPNPFLQLSALFEIERVS